MKKILMLCVCYVLTLLSQVFAQETGISWEFNENGNNEGWGIYRDLSEITVSDGFLETTITGYQPTLSGPDFRLKATDYGFVQMRIRANGATSAKLSWKTNTDLSGSISVAISGDSLFHDYDIPVYTSTVWSDSITSINKIRFYAPPGTEIQIDYIRIVTLGSNLKIECFKPLRTVCKQGKNIPLIARIKNRGDQASSDLTTDLLLPDTFTLVSGENSIFCNALQPDEEIELNWTVKSEICDEYQLVVKLDMPDAANVLDTLSMKITDKYWKQDEFIVSSWFSASAAGMDMWWDKYDSLYFESMITRHLTDSPADMVAKVSEHEIKCLLNIRREDIIPFDYLPWNTMEPPPAITNDILQNLDPIIEQFKNNPALLGYIVMDEPLDAAIPNIQKIVSYLREKDPERLAFINLNNAQSIVDDVGTTYDEHLEYYLDTVKPEMLSMDYYPFRNDGKNYDYFNSLAHLRKWSLRYDIPFMNVLQLISPEANTRFDNRYSELTPALMRWNLYTSLAYGAKAISYWNFTLWNWEMSEYDHIYNTIKEQNRQLTLLGPVLFKLTSTAVYHTCRTLFNSGTELLPADALVHSVSDNQPFIVSLFKDSSDVDYLMLMNEEKEQGATASIKLNRSVSALKLFNTDTGEWQDVPFESCAEGIVFEQSYLAGEGKLYKVGVSTHVGSKSETQLPCQVCLQQNYPNPFNPVTKINYSLSRAGHVNLTVYDLLGRQVAVLVDKNQKAGEYRLDWNAAQFPSGVYIYRLKTGSKVQTRKMVLVK